MYKMNIKLLIILIMSMLICGKITASDKVLKYTVTVPDKSNKTLTGAVISSDIVDVCCAYLYGMNYIVEDDGTVKVIADNTFSPNDAGVETTGSGSQKIGGKYCSYSKITFRYSRDDVSGEYVQGKAKGLQSGKVLKEAMIAAVKKTKKYKQVKKSKKGYKGMIYPVNKLNLTIGASNVCLTETFCITVK